MPDTASPPLDVAAAPVAADLVLALLTVNGASTAAATLGDAAMVVALQAYYAEVAAAIASAGGEVVKVMGDGVLVAFPRERARDAVAALRVAQRAVTTRWQAHDAGCHVVVRAVAGPVLRAALGPPGAERPDVYGTILNALWRLPLGALVLSPELQAQAGS